MVRSGHVGTGRRRGARSARHVTTDASGSATRSAVVALAAAYYGAAQLVFALEVAGPVAAVVWLPVGVGVAFLYLGGPRAVAGRR